MSIQSPSQALGRERWAIVYERKHYNLANNLHQTLDQASQKLGLHIEDPSWIELDRGDDTFSFAQQLKALIDAKKRPSIVLVMLANERLYKNFKAVCYQQQVVSQCVRYQNFGKGGGMNLSVASNVLRQINSKLGGDLFNLKLCRELLPRTMLIGIDVCHSGPQSIVGFCATVNQQRS